MFFFFSSRRRHTRWPRDWSSDVCSSDLVTCTDALSWISIGDRTNIQENASVHVTHQTHPTRIGNDVTIGDNAMVRGCTLQDRVLVGINATIMDCAVGYSAVLIAEGRPV